MSIKKSLSLRRLSSRKGDAVTKKSLSVNNVDGRQGGEDAVATKHRRFDRWFSFMEVSTEPGKSLKDMDSEKLKAGIRRWAKAVVAYARQVSGRFGSNRS